MKRLKNITLTMFLLLAACGQRSGGPSAWIDQPLDESRHPLQPIQITAHASAPGGIASFEFFVDDASLGEVSVGGGRLELAEITWEPQAPGIYLIGVTATDGEGSVGDRVTSKVYIGDVQDDDPFAGEAPGECEGIEAIFLQLEPAVVEPGDCAVASWQVYGPEEWPVILNEELVPPFGEIPICPEEDTEVQLAIETPHGICRREAAILVQPEDIEPQPGEGDEIFVFLGANPPEIRSGECSTLLWEVGPEREYELALEGEEVPVFGEKQVCPLETTSYALQVGYEGRSLAEYTTVTVLDGEGGTTQVTPTPGVTSTPAPGVTSTPAPGVTPTSQTPDNTKPVISNPSDNTTTDYCFETCSGTANDCGVETFFITVSVTDNVSSGNDIAVTLNWTGSGVRSGPLSMHWAGSGSTYFRYIGSFQNSGSLSSFSITATDKAGNTAQLSLSSWQLDVEDCTCGGGS
jgi:hypothetical protein